MNLLIVTVAIALHGVPQAADRKAPHTGVPSGPVREQVETFLSTIDTPVSAQQWQALGPDAAPVLMEIASTRSHLPSRRARAVEALGMRKDARAADLVNGLATTASEPKSVRMAAVRALPQVARDRAQAALAPLLQDGDLHIRAATAGALATLGTGGCKLVAQRLQRETGEERALMERHSAACRKP
jgi:HEAT repeat protein